MKAAIGWVWDNRQWLFSGVAVSALLLLFQLFRKRGGAAPVTAHESAAVATGSNISQSVNSPAATGSNISQTINSPTVVHAPTINVAIPVPPAGTGEHQRYNEWRELVSELDKSLSQIVYAFLEINVMTPGDDSNNPQAGVQRGLRAIDHKLLIADALRQAHIREKYLEIVHYAFSAHEPRDPRQRGCPTVQGFDVKAQAFQEELTRMAQEDMRSFWRGGEN